MDRHVSKTYRYGAEASQEADLYLPSASRPPVVCLLHGGFWRMPYGRDQLESVACDLAARGFAVWNIGYRRLAEPGGGWPGTFCDVADAIDHLARLAAQGKDLDLGRVVVAGHSAGGQLAFFAASRRPAAAPLRRPARVRPIAVAGLAAILDLAAAFESRAGGAAAEELLDGSPAQRPERYAATSPLGLLPFGIPQLILHGSEDSALPIAGARTYAQAASAAGDPVRFIELPEAGHMDFIDPRSAAHQTFCAWLESLPSIAGGS